MANPVRLDAVLGLCLARLAARCCPLCGSPIPPGAAVCPLVELERPAAPEGMRAPVAKGEPMEGRARGDAA